jgi:hypothetical protein
MSTIHNEFHYSWITSITMITISDLPCYYWNATVIPYGFHIKRIKPADGTVTPIDVGDHACLPFTKPHGHITSLIVDK